jgi:hypothetical protein
MEMPFMRAPNLAAVAVAAIAVLSPALSLPAATAAAKPAKPSACFYSRNVDGFNAPNDTTVYLRVGVRDVYEAKLFAPCTNIDWSQHIALKSGVSDWVCEGSGATGVEIFAPSPIGPQHCPVTSIRKLTPAQLAALPKKDRP